MGEVKREWLVIPDVHGRTFWKDAVVENPELPVVFLGDYLDPYPWERISAIDTINNFNEIMLYKANHPDDVTLLLGNHDFSYIYRGICDCRKDYVNNECISAMFEDGLNDKMFDMCKMLPGDKVLMSHSGVHLSWVNSWLNSIWKDAPFDGCELEEVTRELVDQINARLHELDRKFFNSLRQVSWLRGGMDAVGSMVWADMREWHAYDKMPYQVFGHTQLERDEPVVTEHWANLDCRHAFMLTEDGEVMHLDKTPCEIVSISKEYKS